MMKKWAILLFLVATILAGCTDKDEKAQAEPSTMIEVKVDYLVDEKQPFKKELPLSVHVTQGKEDVDDATSVKFEIWNSGEREQGKQYDAKLKGKGVYEAAVPIAKEGVYYVYAHTEARGLHVMPKKQFIIGNPDLKKVKKE